MGSLFFFSGCSYFAGFTISGTMCEPNAYGSIPQECQNYNDDAATNSAFPPKTDDQCPDCNKVDKVGFESN